MAVYRAVLTFDSFKFSGVFSEASSQLWYVGEEEDHVTPYQVADARHSPHRAALLLLEYLGRDYWLDPSDYQKSEDGEESFAGKSEEEYLKSLIVRVEKVD